MQKRDNQAKKSQKPKRALGYCRVSSAGQVEGESLETQRSLIEAICRLEGLELAGVFVEEGVSGSRPLASRPSGRDLLAALQPGDCVVALRLDRVFRSVPDAVNTLATLERRGVRLYLRDVGGFVSGDAAGTLVFSLLTCVASFERSRTRERIVEVKSALAEQGRYGGGSIPFAHKLTTAQEPTRRGAPIRFAEPDEVVMGQARDLLARGYSSRTAAGWFAERGVKVSHHAVARLFRRLRAEAA